MNRDPLYLLAYATVFVLFAVVLIKVADHL
jgi:hypothetical protein